MTSNFKHYHAQIKQKKKYQKAFCFSGENLLEMQCLTLMISRLIIIPPPPSSSSQKGRRMVFEKHFPLHDCTVKLKTPGTLKTFYQASYSYVALSLFTPHDMTVGYDGRRGKVSLKGRLQY